LTIRFISQLLKLKKLLKLPVGLAAFSFFKQIRLDDNVKGNYLIEAHERVHARQWHSADVLFVELVAIINWFNPVVYLYKQVIKHIHEFIADSYSLKTGASKTEYAMLLLSETFKIPTHNMVNTFFNESLLKQRIVMLNKKSSARIKLVKYGLSAPLFVLMLILSSATLDISKPARLFGGAAEDVLLSRISDNSAKTNVNQLDTIPVKLKEPVFSAVEHQPYFPGGIEKFYQFLGANIKYPVELRKSGVQGKVFVNFIVEKDGSLSTLKILKDIGHGAGDETMRVMKLSPKWEPGVQNGRKVRVNYTVPINFTLNDVPKKETAGPKTRSLAQGRDSVSQLASVDTGKRKAAPVSGINTGGAQPLCVVNGIEKPASILNTLNPNSIQSINVLKNTSAQSLYGDKGKNGVIVITTKQKAN
jgi:TonB family protein